MKIKRTREYKKLFSKGDTFEPKGKLSVIVGDNGCGKSTLIKIFIDKLKNESAKFIHVDLEKSNPSISTPTLEKPLQGPNAEELSLQFMWAAESHGETREGVLLGLFEHIKVHNCLVIFDEPEQGLSLRNQIKYANKLKNSSNQNIVITHSKVFIESVEEVFDVESMQWISSKKYLKSFNI